MPSINTGLIKNESSVVEQARSLMEQDSKESLNTPSDNSTADITQDLLQNVASSLLALLNNTDSLTKAHDNGQQADQFQDNYNKARAEFDNGNGQNPPGKGGMFYNGAHAVMNRNNELNNLNQYVKEADVDPGRDRAVFWSGDQLNADGAVKYSAMNTAQSYARDNDKLTVELTPGGHDIDSYMGHPNSFNELNERFSFISQNSDPNLSNAGAMWDILSQRFAAAAEGEVTAIHAGGVDDPYFSSTAYENSTWKAIEEPQLRENGAEIDEKFGGDVEEYLSEP